MSLLRYTQRESPPDGFSYKCPHTGHRIVHFNKRPWLAAIEKYNADNGFAQPDNWRELAEHEACALMPVGFCQYADGSLPGYTLNRRGTVETVLAGTRVMIAWALSGSPLVSPEVAEERAKTCAACYAAIPMEGCGGCANFIGKVMDAVGKGTTSADNQLVAKQCAWCGCSALANVWMPTEVSQAGVTDEMLSATLDHCWKLKEVRALRDGNNNLALDGQAS